MRLSEFIKSYRTEHGISLRAFGARSGLSAAYLSMLEREFNPQTGLPIKPTLKAYAGIAKAMGITLNELFSQVDDVVELDEDFYIPYNVEPLPGTMSVPRLGAIACGEPILAEQNIEGYDAVPDYVKCDFTLECKGDSMTGARIYDGDIVCIRRQPEVESGQIAAVVVEGDYETGATLKRVRYGADHSIALWPENPNYSPMYFTREDVNRVRIIGLATHFISRVK